VRSAIQAGPSPGSCWGRKLSDRVKHAYAIGTRTSKHTSCKPLNINIPVVLVLVLVLMLMLVIPIEMCLLSSVVVRRPICFNPPSVINDAPA
jgi:hypothetical protein